MASLVFATSQSDQPEPLGLEPSGPAAEAPLEHQAAALPDLSPEEESSPPRGRGQGRRRAHSSSTGQFLADDPATPDRNEAFADGDA